MTVTGSREDAALPARSAALSAPSPGRLLAAGIGAVVIAVIGALLMYELGLASVETLALVVAALLAALVGWLAVTRFDWFVILLLVIRSSLDVLGLGGSAGGALDPGAAVGSVFVVAASLWLVMKWRTRDWVVPSPPTKALFGLAAAAFASVPMSESRVVSVEASVRLTAGVLMFAVLEQLLARHRYPLTFIRALYASVLVPVLLGFYQVVSGAGDGQTADYNRVLSTFAHPNPFATFLVLIMSSALALALATRGPVRLVSIIVVCSAAPLLLFTYTRAGWLAFLVASLYLGYRLDRRVVLMIGLACLAAIAISPSILGRITDITDPQEIYTGAPSNSMEWRIGYWQQLIPLAGATPLTGIGLESVQHVTDEKLQPHNGFVQAYVEMGILGVAALSAVVLTMAAQLRRRLREASTSLELTMACGAIAASLAVVVQIPSENLLTQTIFYWYFALAQFYGYGRGRLPTRRRPQVASVS